MISFEKELTWFLQKMNNSKKNYGHIISCGVIIRW